MDYKIVLSPPARADLRDIVRYISFDAPDKAPNSVNFLFYTRRSSRGFRNVAEQCRSLMTLSFAKSLFARIGSSIVSIIRNI